MNVPNLIQTWETERSGFFPSVVDINDSGSLAQDCRCYEQLKATDDMNDFGL